MAFLNWDENIFKMFENIQEVKCLSEPMMTQFIDTFICCKTGATFNNNCMIYMICYKNITKGNI